MTAGFSQRTHRFNQASSLRRRLNPESGGEGTQLHMHPLSADGLSSHLGRQSNYIRLIPRHTPGHQNVFADGLSRRLQTINTRWSPSQQLSTHAWCLWGQLHMGVFAMTENVRLPRYVVHHFWIQKRAKSTPSKASIKTLSLNIPLDVPVCPVPTTIEEVLQCIQTTQCQVILIAPACPTQPSFSLLLSLLDDQPRHFPLIRTLLKQPQSPIFTGTHSVYLCMRRSSPVSPHPAWLLFDHGGAHHLLPEEYHAVRLWQQMDDLHRVVPRIWKRSIIMPLHPF